MKISVIIPTYNHSKYLPSVISSLLMQTKAPHEIIIINDGSTDDTYSVLKRYSEEINYLKVYNLESNMGVVYAANYGAEKSSGDYIYFAADDDLISREFLEKNIELFNKYPNAALCSSIVYGLKENGEYFPITPVNIFESSVYFNPEDCLTLFNKYGCWMGGNTTIFKRSIFLGLGGLRSELGPYSDLYVEVASALTFGVCFNPIILGVQKIIRNSYSSKLRKNKTEMLQYQQIFVNLLCNLKHKNSLVKAANLWANREIILLSLSFMSSDLKIIFNSFKINKIFYSIFSISNIVFINIKYIIFCPRLLIKIIINKITTKIYSRNSKKLNFNNNPLFKDFINA